MRSLILCYYVMVSLNMHIYILGRRNAKHVGGNAEGSMASGSLIKIISIVAD